MTEPGVTSIGRPDDRAGSANGCAVIYVSERNPLQRACRFARLNDPTVTTVGCVDDSSVVTRSRSRVGVYEVDAVERVTLRKRILPDPVGLGFDRTFLIDFSLSERAWQQKSGEQKHREE